MQCQKTKKMKSKIAILLITFIVVSAYTASAQVDEKAKKILDELSAKTKAFTSIIANFSYTVENKEQKTNETQDGKITIKGKKYKLEIANQTVINDTKNTYTVLKDAKEVQKNSATSISKDKSENIDPSNIFTMYETGFKYQFVKEEKQKSGAVYQIIKLFPNETKKRNFHTIMLTIDKVKKQIVMIKIMGKDGTDTTYNVKKFLSNTKVDDVLFALNMKSYPGYELIDLTE